MGTSKFARAATAYGLATKIAPRGLAGISQRIEPRFDPSFIEAMGRSISTMSAAASSASRQMQQLTANTTGLGQAFDTASIKSQQLQIAIIQSVAGAIQAITSGGNAAGIFGGLLGIAGGIAGIVNPVVGAALAAGGGLLAGLASRSNDPIRVRIDSHSDRALAQQRGRSGPDNVRVIVVTATDAILADVQRRLDEVSALNGEDVLAGVRVSG